jgi:beta propeller repeat protein
MRRVLMSLIAAATLAACTDQPVFQPKAARGWESPRSFADRSAAGAPAVSDVRTLGYNEGGLLYGQNLPLPDVGGGRVVWQDGSDGGVRVVSYDLRSGEAGTAGTASGGWLYPATDGRYTAWSDQGTVYLHDDVRGTTEAVGTGGGVHVSGGTLAWVDYVGGAANAVVYDAHTGRTTQVTHYTAESNEGVRAVDVDGQIVAFSTYTRSSPYTTAIRYVDLATGTEHLAAFVPSQAVGDPSVSRGQIVWSDDRSGNYDVYLFDVRTGAERQITTDPGGQFNAQISGNLIVWEDSRNSTSHYFPMNDVYGFDLTSGTELAIATGDDHQGWPRVDGHTVIWTERANDRWEIRAATVQGRDSSG